VVFQRHDILKELLLLIEHIFELLLLLIPRVLQLFVILLDVFELSKLHLKLLVLDHHCLEAVVADGLLFRLAIFDHVSHLVEIIEQFLVLGLLLLDLGLERLILALCIKHPVLQLDVLRIYRLLVTFAQSIVLRLE